MQFLLVDTDEILYVLWWQLFLQRTRHKNPLTAGNLSLYVAKFTNNEMSHISTYNPIITSEH